MTTVGPVDDRSLHEVHTEQEIDDGSWECTNPEPVEDEPWVTDPECAGCGHKTSCCQDNHYMCDCDDDEDEYL